MYFGNPFVPPDGRKGMNEFDRIWLEYKERFGIDFEANADPIAFADTMREVTKPDRRP